MAKIKGATETNMRIWDTLGKTDPGQTKQFTRSGEMMITSSDARVHVDEGGCWIWQGTRDRDGYGRISINGSDIRVHRLTFSQNNPQINIAGLIILHGCDTPPCCNPDHLSAGTHQDNHDDRGRKGRTAKGSRHGKSKLTEQQVEEIRARYFPGNGQLLATEFGVYRTAIHKIIHGYTRPTCQK